jgi:transcription elongation factor Elf1
MRLPDLEKMKRCPNCGKEAIQVIEAQPGETIITCMNCGAARHYTEEGISVQETFDEDVPRG